MTSKIDHAAYQPPPDRRWLKFVLLGSAVFLMLFAFPLVWVGSEYFAAQQRLAAITTIESKGGLVGMPPLTTVPADRPFAQQVVTQILGDKCYIDASAVTWSDKDISPILPALLQLRELRSLSLHDVTLSESDTLAIARLPLQGLTLQKVEISPRQLQQFATISKLSQLHLTDPAASDEHLEQLPAFPALKSLMLSDTQLTPDSLKPLAHLANLEQLVIVPPETVPEEALEPLSQLKHIPSLSLILKQPVEDSLFDKISQMDGLETLRIGIRMEDQEIECSAEGLAKLGELSRLKQLQLTAIPITDDALCGICQAQQLEHLIIDGSQITDAGIKHLSKLKKLTHLTLYDGQLSDVSLKELAKLPALETIELGDNHLRTRANNFGLPRTEDAP
ncbi:leucine-rich repeat domain-containing protein [Blastopirellula marina]|uniref:Leucine Rich repeats (2 copies) n=1 Tax=Blastopirellula marina TaxID=124 RepID=A0A2S8GPB8_9BACT|nr:leucine-rich repeat domain-containing protein [Blastopirellula marina]PQO46269.1 hypothetical protein C5Y93_09795 [Blastopirellula marina]